MMLSNNNMQRNHCKVTYIFVTTVTDDSHICIKEWHCQIGKISLELLMLLKYLLFEVTKS
jgi:hypothetical protein